MRPRDPLSPASSSKLELDALERALAGEPVDPDLRELAELVEDVRATAPQMTPGFAARLDHEVAEGFPASHERPARRPSRRWLLLPAGGCLAAALVALVVVLSSGGDGAPSRSLADRAATVEDSSGSGANAGQADSEAAPSGTKAVPAPAVAPHAAPAAPPAAAHGGAGSGSGASSSAGSAKAAPAPAPLVAQSRAPRKVQRSADLVLRVSDAKVDEAADGVISTVDRFGGIVATSQSSSEGSHGEATFDLRIPTERLDDALAALSKLGHVVERHQELADITGSFTSAQSRLSDARAERRGLLRALGRADTQAQIDSLRQRLRDVRSEIARRTGDLDALRRRADLSTVSVTIRGTARSAAAGSGSGGGGWTPGDAARDAVRVLEVIAGVALIALAVLAPLALLGAIVAFGVGTGRRRRRERALDPA